MARGASISNRLAQAQEVAAYDQASAVIVAQMNAEAAAAKQQRVYRLYTEDFANVSVIAAKYFDSFSVQYQEEYWKGQKENSVVVEVVVEVGTVAVATAKMKQLADEIRETNHQQVVLVTSHPVDIQLVA